MIAFASRANMIKGLVGGGVGIMLSLVGYRKISGTFRFTLSSDYLWDGIPLVPFVVGLFAASELISYSARGGATVTADKAVQINQGSQVLVGIRDVFSRPWQWLRTYAIGAGIGTIPGLGGGVASFMSYFVGMQRTTEPELYG